MGLGLRNQVECPEIKANGPARGGFRSSRVLPRAGAEAWRSCRCGEGQCGAEGRAPRGWRALGSLPVPPGLCPGADGSTAGQVRVLRGPQRSSGCPEGRCWDG